MLRAKDLVILAVFGLSIGAQASPQNSPKTHVRFIVLGDDRIRFPGDGGLRKGYDNEKSGIDEGVFGPLLSDALRRNPDFVLVTGDLVGGESKNLKSLPDLKGQLSAWLKLVNARNPKSVPIFPIRGNHETKTHDPSKAWGAVAAATKKYGKRVDKFQTDGFNLGFNFGNVTIVGLDCYRVKSNNAEVDWAKQVLKSKKQYVFAFSHPMLFFTGGHEDHIVGKNRDELLDVLMLANCKAYFAGHDHLYDFARISREDDRWHGRALDQYVAGTAGAPFYKADPLPKTDEAEDGSIYKISRLQHVENTFAYLIVDVDTNSYKVTPIFYKVPGLKDPSSMKSGG
jgi:DNA repair exonuclease SbcCD nuclease subunit